MKIIKSIEELEKALTESKIQALRVQLNYGLISHRSLVFLGQDESARRPFQDGNLSLLWNDVKKVAGKRSEEAITIETLCFHD